MSRVKKGGCQKTKSCTKMHGFLWCNTSGDSKVTALGARGGLGGMGGGLVHQSPTPRFQVFELGTPLISPLRSFRKGARLGQRKRKQNK